MKRRGSQRILIRSAVKRPVHQLLGGNVTDGSHGDVGVSEVADVIDSASDAEIGQQHPAPVVIGRGDEDVLRLDVTMEQTAIMGEVERISHRCHDLRDVLFRHAVRVTLPNQSTCVSAVHVGHRDPEPAVEFTTIENADDMGVPQRRCQFALANEPRPKFVVGGRDR